MALTTAHVTTTGDFPPLPVELPVAPLLQVPSYAKRFRMDIDLSRLPHGPALSLPYRFLCWDTRLIDDHADVLFDGFRDEVDAIVFPSLSSRAGCRLLMRDIGSRRGFVPESTWLIRFGGDEPCGTVQGVRTSSGFGAIQNLGVVPEHRGLGLGAALLLQSLWGFASVGLRKAYLEVTASNAAAIRLYRSIGFHKTKTLYKAVHPPDVAVLE
jgi:hypothetical protein